MKIFGNMIKVEGQLCEITIFPASKVVNGKEVDVAGLTVNAMPVCIKSSYNDADKLENNLEKQLANLKDGDKVEYMGVRFIVQFNGNYSNRANLLPENEEQFFSWFGGISELKASL